MLYIFSDNSKFSKLLIGHLTKMWKISSRSRRLQTLEIFSPLKLYMLFLYNTIWAFLSSLFEFGLSAMQNFKLKIGNYWRYLKVVYGVRFIVSRKLDLVLIFFEEYIVIFVDHVLKVICHFCSLCSCQSHLWCICTSI